jgi:hypothetical protein
MKPCIRAGVVFLLVVVRGAIQFNYQPLRLEIKIREDGNSNHQWFGMISRGKILTVLKDAKWRKAEGAFLPPAFGESVEVSNE